MTLLLRTIELNDGDGGPTLPRKGAGHDTTYTVLWLHPSRPNHLYSERALYALQLTMR